VGAAGATAAGGAVGAAGTSAAGGTVGAKGISIAGGTVGAGAAGGEAFAGGAVAAGGAVESGGVVAGGGAVGARGPLATGGAVSAGGAVGARGAVAAGAFVTSGAESDVPGQLDMGSASGIVEGSVTLLLMVEDGGHAGIVCSVGGSGGQMSVSSGTAPSAGATSSRPAAPSPGTGSDWFCRPPAGGHVRFEVVAGGSVSPRGSPAGAGTV
jgi:hypothetical protein